MQFDHGFLLGLHLCVVRIGEFAPDHKVCKLPPVGLLGFQRADCAARAQNRNAVADVQHLAHLVADKDNALAFGTEFVDDFVEVFHLDIREHRGRFVQNQNFRAAVKRFENLHALLRANGNIGNLCVGVDIQPVALGERDDLFFALVHANEHALIALVAKDDVLQYRHSLDQHEMLVHHADAEANRHGRGFDFYLLSAQNDIALRGLIEPDQNVHQRAFSRAVFTQQGMHLALSDGKGHVPVGVKTAELLADMLHAQDFVHRFRPLFSLKRILLC
ncbi:hypothetical protein SDC9_108321 [bioreactor metagenome]|uniref:Uncharacterized protein n=1 Tax=bioreactor metagenome TaxID=1076179 RepID=A0A645B9Y8_9ZZZZ